MPTTKRVVLGLAALLPLTGCLTPSMGRAANVAMGGAYEPYPLSARDAPTAHMVGQRYDGESTEGWLIVDKPAPGEPARATNVDGHFVGISRPTE